jgi:hypothetical protein
MSEGIADRDRDSALVVCFRLVSVLSAHLIKNDLRRQNEEATSPEEAEIIGWFIEGTERIIRNTRPPPQLHVINGGAAAQEETP